MKTVREKIFVRTVSMDRVWHRVVYRRNLVLNN